MGDRLQERGTLIGLSRTEVVEMLGEPEVTAYFQEYDLVYWLGDERGYFSIDSEWLVLRIVDGRVASAKIVTD